MTEKTPCFLYHEDCRKGKIFYDIPSVNKALAAGWMTGPLPIPSEPDVAPAPVPVPVKEPELQEPKKPAPKPRKPRTSSKGKK